VWQKIPSGNADAPPQAPLQGGGDNEQEKKQGKTEPRLTASCLGDVAEERDMKAQP
jgi:hypothetical protein